MTEQHERYANELEKELNKFSENVNKILEEMFSFESESEKDWEMKCPYKDKDEYWLLNNLGEFSLRLWYKSKLLDSYFYQGNVFSTKQAAELEAKRRNLLTRFRAFRDECNDGWKPDWNDHNSKKWVIAKNEEGIYAMWTVGLNAFSYFGCFKNRFVTERAIELFGDEIQKLFIDCECD